MKGKYILIQAEKISTILKAAKIDIEPFWPELFAKCCESMDIKKFITNIGSADGTTTNNPGGGDPAAATNADSGKVAPVEDDKKQESDSDDSGEDFFPDLFG